MAKPKALSIFVVLILTVLTVASTLCAPPGLSVERFVDDELGATFLCLWTLGAMPITFWLPRVRARFFAPTSHLPSRAYLLPVVWVRICLLFAAGQVLGFSLLAVFLDIRIFWLAGSALATMVAFWAGARYRLRQPMAEFEIPWLRWTLRGFGWRLRK